LSQPVFGFNNLKWDKRIEPLKRSEAQKKFSVDMLQIQSQATTLFFDLLVAHQEASIAQKNEENNQQLFRIAEERLTLGRISRGDLKQLELELISARQARRQAEQAVYYASAAIYDFLGRPYSEEAIVPVFPKGDTKEPVDPTIVLQKAMANNPDLIAQQRMLLEVNRDLERAKRENGPQVNINASFGLVRSSKDFSDIYKDPKQEQFAQVQLTIPIVDWGARKAAVGIAQTQRDFTERSIQQQKRTFQTVVLQTAEEVNFLIQDLELAESVEQIALERFEISKESYVLGAISITELTLAQREKDQAQRQYTRTVREYWGARGRLLVLVNE
jgi:outer membrane protein